MRSTWHRAVFVGFVLVMSSLAGCIGTDDDESDEGKYGTVVVSTYHIAEIVSAIAGDTVNVEMISTDNTPVHDLDPGTPELVRIGDSDLFLYHGLGLEPWVDGKIAELGDNAPAHHSVHTMPSGEIDLDYEFILGNQLCSLLNSPSAEVMTMLSAHAEDSGEIEGEDSVYNIAFPEDEHDEHDHDEEGHEEGEHDHDEDEHEHGEEGHDDEHDHGEHSIVEAEEELTEGLDKCPSDFVASIYHLEAGVYILEFEGEDVESFHMAIAQMQGAHDHAHGDHDDHEGEDGHDEHDGHGVCHDMTNHEDKDFDSEDECEAAGFIWMEEEEHEEHEGEMSAEDAMQEADTNNDGKMSWEEFEAMWEMDDDHGHDEEHEEGCHDANTHESHDEYSNEDDCEAAGHIWMEDHDEEGCHDATTHETHDEYTNQADCEAAGHMWMEEDDHDDHDEEDDYDPLEEAMEDYMMSMIMDEFNHSDEDGDMLLDLDELGHFIEAMDEMEDMGDGMVVDVLIFAFDEDGDEMLSFDEYMHLWDMEDDDHDDHDHGNETDEGHDNETHDENETMEDMFMEMFQMMFNMSDADGNGYLDSTELEVMMVEMMEEDHEEGVAYIHLHIEEGGEYGIALPDHVELHVLSQGGHEGHDHGEHEHEEEGHDEEGHDEELAYDPHSWLDPVAYAAQVDVVLGHLITTFPDGEDLFKANANAFKAELVKLDEQFESLSENCQDMSVVANHNAYSYMAYRYDIQFVTVHGLDPEGEPTPEDLAEVIEHIEEEGITVLYVEEYTDASSVDSIVEATGVTVKTLYTMEMAPMDTDDDYLSLMQKNFENLEAGMSCSA